MEEPRRRGKVKDEEESLMKYLPEKVGEVEAGALGVRGAPERQDAVASPPVGVAQGGPVASLLQGNRRRRGSRGWESGKPTPQ